MSELIVDANGDLFGTTFSGGAYNRGSVFEIKNYGTIATPNYGNAPTTLSSFDGSVLANPLGGLIADANGNLFGTSTGGAASPYGSVFEIKNTGTVAAPIYVSAPITVLFNGLDGKDPMGN
jgi:uncharacterized repeat protein (TIGR03803 family)